jgi:Tol biopolymer transport system component
MSLLAFCASMDREVRAMKWLSRGVLALALPCLLVLVFAASGGSSSGGDGGRIAFVKMRFCGYGHLVDCGRYDIAVVSPDGSGLRTLTHERAAVRVSEYSPRWSPDRREIAYLRPNHTRYGQGSDGQVWLMAADGTHQRALTHFPQSGSIYLFTGSQDGPVLDWAPSGRQIVFASGLAGSHGGLFLINVSTGAVKRLLRTRFGTECPVWSPNGRWIAFGLYRHGGTWGQLFVLSTVTHRLHQLTHFPPWYAPRYPAWSPDSRQIAFSFAAGHRRGEIAVINDDGSHLHSLNATGIQPSWSPDGRWIVFSNAPSVYSLRHGNLEVMRPNGSDRHLITHVPRPRSNWGDQQPDW